MKRRNLENQFTYGFEMEGMFSESLESKVRRQVNSIGVSLERKDDCSVEMGDDEGETNMDYTEDREWAIGIFSNFSDFIGTLKQFTEPHHVWNGSCGLHVHIKPKDNNVRLMMGDKDLIREMQTWAFRNLCNHIQGERSGNDYCQRYPVNFEGFVHDWKYREKYRFVRNHPSGTFEFRFPM